MSNYPGSHRQTPKDECALCGYPRREHSLNGACYGICGKFVDQPPAEPGDALREALRAYARTFQHGEKVWPREFMENALAYALATKENAT